ncbi:hypothetical protein RYX36_007030 [Vicia faba]
MVVYVVPETWRSRKDRGLEKLGVLAAEFCELRRLLFAADLLHLLGRGGNLWVRDGVVVGFNSSESRLIFFVLLL